MMRYHVKRYVDGFKTNTTTRKTTIRLHELDMPTEEAVDFLLGYHGEDNVIEITMCVYWTTAVRKRIV